MGILNVTPDSFSDGGRFISSEAAIAHAGRLIDEGADILDIGGESTRPGSERVAPEEQIRRVIPVITAVRAQWDGPISIDTTRAQVARAALEAGANWVNDISALRDDERMGTLVADRRCPIVLMHMQGTPGTMQQSPSYDHVVSEVIEFLSSRAKFAESVGVSRDNIIIDPGIGFGKTLEHNIDLLSHIERLVGLGYRVLIGVSRKSFIGQLSGAPVDDRLPGSLAAALHSARAGVQIVRVHDVAPTRQALTVASAMAQSH
jgi:dihydropteroate synthase